MSEQLVPKDRPYGERKKLVSEMRAGNIPTEPRSGDQGVPSPQSPAPRAAAPGVPSEYDVFASRQPSQPQAAEQAPPPITTGGILAETAQTAANPFIREFATRLTQLRRG